jgi:cytochrome c553
MKKRHPAVSILALTALFSGALQAAGDPVAGAQKAAACATCHGNKDFPGMFFSLQLAGRDADKLAIKTDKYRRLKIINPMMNIFVVGLSDQDVEDISTYYHSLGKPAFVNPLFPIKGDDDAPAADKVSVAPPAR